MATPSEVFTEMVTTTLRNHSRQVVDNISDHNALLRAMKQRGNIKNETGGYEIVYPLEYAENTTYQRYSGYDAHDVSATDVLTSAKYDWKQVAIQVTASGRELRQNNGPEAMVKLVQAKKKNALNTAANQLSIDIYSSGALTNQIGGLGNLIQNNGQGTVGGINSATFTFWRNQFREADGNNTWSKSTIKGEMNRLWLTTVRGTDKPDVIVSSHDFYSAYEEALQDNQRYTDVQNASAGFESLKYKSASVIFDDNTNFGTTAEKMYFLNTKYLFMVQHSQAQWTPQPERTPVNQDAIVIPMYWMGNMVCTNRALQGVLIDAS